MEPLILEICTRGLHRYHQIDADVTTIGRALDNDIILSDPTIAPHHLKIIRHGDDSLELVNLAEVNPARINNRRLESLLTEQLPVELELGRVQARILPRKYRVAATKPLAGDGRPSHLFGHSSWAAVLVLACLVLGGLEFYLNLYTSFKWADLFKYVLRETVLTLGVFVLALAVLERLLVNRWEIKQVVTSVSLVFLLYFFFSATADGLRYLFSANWPATLIHFGWNLLIIPAAITLYLVHISHLQLKRSIILAIMIASPISVPSLLQSPQLKVLLDDFSSSARYQNSLSALNWHLSPTVSINRFIDQAKKLDAGEFAD